MGKRQHPRLRHSTNLLPAVACVCISTKNGATMLRFYQNTIHRWWSLWL